MTRTGRPPKKLTGTDCDAVLGRKIREIREAGGKTIAEVAGSIGVAASTWTHWEHGRGIPLDRWTQIAGALGLESVGILAAAFFGELALPQ